MEIIKRHGWSLAAIAVLVLAVVALGVYSRQQYVRADALQSQVDASNQKAFFETVDLMSALEVNLEKLTVTASRAQEQSLLIEIARQADTAQDNLAMLPMNQEAVSGTLKFVNQLGDYARVLAENVASGKALSLEDQQQLGELYQYCRSLNDHLKQLEQGIETGEVAWPDSPVVSPQAGGDILKDPGQDYPTLLYDGPFSDGRDTGAFKGLGSEQIDEEEAKRRAIAFVGEDRVVEIQKSGEAIVPVPCYEFEIETRDMPLSISITRQGGKVLYMLPGQGVEGATLSQANCIDRAQAFLSERGFGAMQVSYWQQFGGLLTVNFAATQGDVLLYPDLVKVQVNMQDGQVVGIEAQNYWRNHVSRSLVPPVLPLEQAQGQLNGRLKVERGRVCLIPTDAGELMAYEFLVELSQVKYLVYVNANTGEEVTILKILEDQDGQLAV